MFDDIQAAIPLGFFLSFMIGPVFFVLLETSITKGFRAAISFDIGVLIADVLFITAAYFSSFKLLENLSNQPGLFVFGGAILIVYGIVTFLNKAPKKQTANVGPKKENYFNLFIKGFFLNFINIGVLVFWLGVIIIVGPSVNNDPNRILVFFGTMIGVYFITDVLKILLAKQLKRHLTKNKIKIIKKSLGVLLVICGVVLMIKGFLPKDQFNIEKGLETIEQMRE